MPEDNRHLRSAGSSGNDPSAGSTRMLDFFVFGADLDSGAGRLAIQVTARPSVFLTKDPCAADRGAKGGARALGTCRTSGIELAAVPSGRMRTPAYQQGHAIQRRRDRDSLPACPGLRGPEVVPHAVRQHDGLFAGTGMKDGRQQQAVPDHQLVFDGVEARVVGKLEHHRAQQRHAGEMRLPGQLGVVRESAGSAGGPGGGSWLRQPHHGTTGSAWDRSSAGRQK